MKKVMAILICFALVAASGAVFAGCGKQAQKNEDEQGANPLSGGEVVGGWTKADSPEITEDFRKVFDKAAQYLTGVEYTPVAYLANQVVAGTNHRVLCKATATVPDAETTYAIVTIYEDLNGNAEITKTVDCEAQAGVTGVDGGWSEPDSPAVTDEARSALEKACETLTGAEYTPVALLATQVVAGTNYRLLCESTATVPDAQTEYVIVTVYADLEGHAEITGTAAFEEDQSAQTEQYAALMDSLDSARDAAGFPMAIPENIEVENIIVINGTTIEVDFNGGYIRKGLGSEDVSGDYNDYDATETKTVDGREITLKGTDGKVMLAIWTEDDYTYCVSITDGTSEEKMLSLVNATK